MTLMADAAKVIEMRIKMMALGESTPAELFLMVSEKMNAMEEAQAIVARGGNPSLVIENYQKIVAANVARLSGGSKSDLGRKSHQVYLTHDEPMGQGTMEPRCLSRISRL